MEKHTTKPKSKLLKYLPRAASAVSFQNPIFSPGREKKRFYPSSSGFSGTIVSIIPDEARRWPRKGASRGTVDDDDDGMGSTREPTSPKVSCIGQIKLHKEKKKKKMMMLKKAYGKQSATRSVSHSHHHPKHYYEKQGRHHHHHHDKHDGDQHKAKEEAKAKKQGSKILKILGVGFGSKSARSADRSDDHGKSSGDGAGKGGGSSNSGSVPSLGQMKRFASGRQSLSHFDWTAQIAPVNDLDHRNCHSDEEFRVNSDGEEEEKEMIIPHSAPILMGGEGVGLAEPKREVNLWQRRNTAPPPLQLKPIKVRAK